MACGDAEQALTYSIQRSAAKTTLVIGEKPSPLSLEIMPDGSINGSGTVQVKGRIITGTTDDLDKPFTFAPNVASCALGRLTAGTEITMPVPGAPTPVADSPAVSNRPAAGRGNAPAATGGAT